MACDHFRWTERRKSSDRTMPFQILSDVLQSEGPLVGSILRAFSFHLGKASLDQCLGSIPRRLGALCRNLARIQCVRFQAPPTVRNRVKSVPHVHGVDPRVRRAYGPVPPIPRKLDRAASIRDSVPFGSRNGSWTVPVEREEDRTDPVRRTGGRPSAPRRCNGSEARGSRGRRLGGMRGFLVVVRERFRRLCPPPQLRSLHPCLVDPSP